jgi:NADH-quinone oxidoreductase subunit M
VLFKKNLALPDMTRREIAVFVPLVVMIFWIGLYPKPFFDKMQPTVETWITDVETGEALSRELPRDFGSPSHRGGAASASSTTSK